MPDVIERETTTTTPAASPVVIAEHGGGGTALAVLLGLLIVGAILFFTVFGGSRYLSGARIGNGAGTTVNVDQGKQPGIQINNPSVEIKPQQPANSTGGSNGGSYSGSGG